MKINSALQISADVPKNNNDSKAQSNADQDQASVVNYPDYESDLKSISEKTVIKSIENANKVIINHNTRAEFSVHEKTKDIVVKIVDTDTDQVLREFPPEKILDLVAKMWELAGIFVDKRR